MKNRGFTLLEMIVALSIFSIAILIIMTTLVSISNLQKKVVAIQTAQDNLRYAFEHMTKEIRTGKIFHCGTGTLTSPQDCVGGGTSFTFKNSVGQTVTYQVVDGQLVKSSDGTLPNCGNGGTYIQCQKITSPSVVIVNRISFYVDGSAGNDGKQSKATIVLEGQVNDPVHNIGKAKLNLQATISKRGLLDRP